MQAQPYRIYGSQAAYDNAEPHDEPETTSSEDEHYALGRAQGRIDMRRKLTALAAELDELKSVMREARQVIAISLRANAPTWYATDEDIAQHMTIRKIDRALQGERT